MGAIAKVDGKDPKTCFGIDESVSNLSNVARKAVSSISKSLGHKNIIDFNDSRTTKFGDVKRVVEAAIKRERACGN